jgi:hypothetical protein
MFRAVIFVFQILGVVNIMLFTRERLHIFIFASKDGKMDNSQRGLEQVWKARMAKEIFRIHGMFKGTIVMLGFDDYDFQQVVLEDRVGPFCKNGHGLDKHTISVDHWTCDRCTRRTWEARGRELCWVPIPEKDREHGKGDHGWLVVAEEESDAQTIRMDVGSVTWRVEEGKTNREFRELLIGERYYHCQLCNWGMCDLCRVYKPDFRCNSASQPDGGCCNKLLEYTVLTS